MARPRNADGQRTRQAILDAALDLFAQKGFFGTSLRDVATAVGVRESALYNYFPSKDALFEALLLADQHSKVERLTSLAEERITDVRVFLEQLVLEAFQSFAEPRQQQLFRIMMSDGIRLARDGRINLFERLGDRRERMEVIMRRLIREGWLRAADPQVLAMSFAAPLFMSRHLQAIDADLPLLHKPAEFARQHVEQFLRGASATTFKPKAAPRGAVTRPRPTERRARRTRQPL
jgi:AcrR family transcriptional regulator